MGRKKVIKLFSMLLIVSFLFESQPSVVCAADKALQFNFSKAQTKSDQNYFVHIYSNESIQAVFADSKISYDLYIPKKIMKGSGVSIRSNMGFVEHQTMLQMASKYSFSVDPSGNLCGFENIKGRDSAPQEPMNKIKKYAKVKKYKDYYKLSVKNLPVVEYYNDTPVDGYTYDSFAFCLILNVNGKKMKSKMYIDNLTFQSGRKVTCKFNKKENVFITADNKTKIAKIK
ncbi:hypothetical protein [Butyrivibrio sp. AC2005]|uniref:hypothetical protein n=1 Tax=Butyrivibrio sp. AC2005 TaxID=1280672 RepID=UPI0012DF3BF0|nr:hypothetical protein [Butyrivibrio sp. AC2005]